MANRNVKLANEHTAPCFQEPSYRNVREQNGFVSMSFGEWAELFSDFEFRVANAEDITSKELLPLRRFLRKSLDSTESTFDSASITMSPEIMERFPMAVPPIKIVDLYYDYRRKLKLDLIWMIFGLPGSRNPMHTDIWSTSTWNLLLVGQKIWQICSLDGATNYVFEQNPGDVLHIPTGWAHEVQYTMRSASITENYLQPEHWQHVAEHQEREGLKSLSKVTQKLGLAFCSDNKELS